MIDGKELTPHPTPPVGKLDSLRGIRTEMVRVYRASRRGQIKTEDMSRFVFALQCIGKVIEQSDLEARLEALERSAAAIAANEEKKSWEKVNGVPSRN